jgi:rRNA pseudouridine-1189 N-methylase Emg1 (Nep1/Mra1 family)
VLELDSTGYAGFLRKYARVKTNDPQHKTLHITMEANILPIFKSDPTDYFFLLTNQGKPVEESMVLKSALDNPVLITGMEHDFESEEQVEVKLEQEKEGYLLTVSTPATREVTTYGSISLKLKNAPVDVYQVRADVIVEKAEDN